MDPAIEVGREGEALRGRSRGRARDRRERLCINPRGTTRLRPIGIGGFCGTRPPIRTIAGPLSHGCGRNLSSPYLCNSRYAEEERIVSVPPPWIRVVSSTPTAPARANERRGRHLSF